MTDTNDKKFDLEEYLNNCSEELQYVLEQCATRYGSITTSRLIGSIMNSAESDGHNALVAAFASNREGYMRLWKQYCTEPINMPERTKDGVCEITEEVADILMFAMKMYAKNGIVGSSHVLAAIIRKCPNIMLSKEVSKCSPEQVSYKLGSNSGLHNLNNNTKSNVNNKKRDGFIEFDNVNLGRDVESFIRPIRFDDSILVHREDVERRIISVLCKEYRPFVLLVGDRGCGKRSMVNCVLSRVANFDVPDKLKGYNAVSINNAMMLDDGIVKMGPDKRMESTLSAIGKAKNCITVIEDIQLYEDASYPSVYSLICTLRGTWGPVIATTTTSGLKRMERSSKLSDLFTVVNCETTDEQFFFDVVRKHADRISKDTGISICSDTIKHLLAMNKRYIGVTNMPGSAIDLLDTSCSSVSTHVNSSSEIEELYEELEQCKIATKLAADNGMSSYREAKSKEDAVEAKIKELKRVKCSAALTGEDIRTGIAHITGMDMEALTTDDVSTLATVGERIEKNVIGQSEAIDKVSKIIKKMRLGIGNTNRTRGNLLFVGPTGVGKTLVAKEVAKELFGSSDAMIRIDMSEYSEKHSVSRLIGAPPGYVGYDNGGQLTSAVKQRRNCVILLDEVEKAHSDIFDIFLQVFDDGRLTDGKGNTIDFRNCMFILTSNVGSREVSDFGTSIGYLNTGNDGERANRLVETALKKKFKPEFINRLDGIVYFNRLTRDNMLDIAHNELRKFIERASGNGYTVQVNNGVAEAVIASLKKEHDGMGARPIVRAIDMLVEDKLVDAVINNYGMKEFTVLVREGEIVISEGLLKDSVLDGSIEVPVFDSRND